MSFLPNSENSNIVACLDLLGFKEKILKESQPEIEKIYDLVFARLESNIPTLESLVVSDSVVLKLISSLENLRALLDLVRSLQVELLLDGILVRGAITAGEVVFKNESAGRTRLYGRAYQEAYHLEQNLAKFPRVILDPKIFRSMNIENRVALSKITNGFELSELRTPLRELRHPNTTLLYWMPANSGFDDLPFVAYGHLLLEKVYDFDKQTRKWKTTIPDFLETLKRLTYEHSDQWSKMQWVRSYLSETFEDYIRFWSRAYPSDGESMAYMGLKAELMSI